MVRVWLLERDLDAPRPLPLPHAGAGERLRALERFVHVFGAGLWIRLPIDAPTARLAGEASTT